MYADDTTLTSTLETFSTNELNGNPASSINIELNKISEWLKLNRLTLNVCFMHACLFGGRCLGRCCKVLLKHPGYTLRRMCLPESEKKNNNNNYISVMYCALFPIFQLSFCLAHLLNFIYLLMWHFCYTEHVSFIYTVYIYRLCFLV